MHVSDNWFDKPPIRSRLETECRLMEKKHPQFRLMEGDKRYPFAGKGTLFWAGRLRTNFGNTFNVAVVYPTNYPYGEIKAYVMEFMAQKSPKHMYQDGHLCLYSNNHDGGKSQGIGMETTAPTVIAWTAAWLNAWEVHSRTGIWPGRE